MKKFFQRLDKCIDWLVKTLTNVCRLVVAYVGAKTAWNKYTTNTAKA